MRWASSISGQSVSLNRGERWKGRDFWWGGGAREERDASRDTRRVEETRIDRPSPLAVGPAFAPVIAGVFQEYTDPGWQSMQWFLTAMGGLAMLLITFFL